MEAIPLTSLLPEGFNPKQYKVHFAVWNQTKHPIDVLATNQEEWQGWNSWRSVNNDSNREFIFSVAQDKHDAALWLFGGIWEVLDRRPKQQAHSYTVALRDDLMGPFIRRLWVRHKRSGRNIRQRMESVLLAMTVYSILEEPFAGVPFPGHDRIYHSLADLQAVVSQARADWRIALESLKGVYVIHDKETGQRYVGSAYGDTGIWQRWTTYADTLHGGNVGLQELLEERRTVLPDQHAVRSARVLVNAHQRRPCPPARIVLEGRAPARSLGHNRN